MIEENSKDMTCLEWCNEVLEKIGDAFAYTMTGVLIAGFGGAVLLFQYGVVVLVFRHAFGVDLPHPFD